MTVIYAITGPFQDLFAAFFSARPPALALLLIFPIFVFEFRLYVM